MFEAYDESLNLSPEDAAALEALLESGLDPSGVGNGGRVARVAAVLGLLDMDPGPDRATRIDVTMAVVMRARANVSVEWQLVPDDEEAVDAWVGAGYREARVAPSLRPRARVLEAVGSLLTDMPASNAESSQWLIESTLDRVQSAIDDESSRMNLETRRGRGVRRMRLADMVSLAAMLLIGFSVVWPVFTSLRYQSQLGSCLSNFNQVGTAMGLYSSTFRDQLPMATASLGGGAWWDVNPRKPSSNSANLFELKRTDFTDLSALACPGNEHAPTAAWDEDAHDWRSLDEISYSYQIMFGKVRPLWHAPARMVILADRSPVVLRAVRGEMINPGANSPNHRSKGQHLLFTDGSAVWSKSPRTEDGNNIWLPQGIETVIEQVRNGQRIDLRGTETPDSEMDVFVGP